MAKLDVVIQESAVNGQLTPSDGEYAIEVKIVGTSPLLMHRYDTESVKAKGRAAKNSQEKKTDDIESYLYREGKEIGIPGKAIAAAFRESARRLADPSSPRKSARDLVAAGLRVEPFLARLGRQVWDYIDEQPVVVQRSRVARCRPAFREGWQVAFRILVLAPEYITEEWLHALVVRAGRFQGLLDGRNIGYGQFRVTEFKRAKLI